MLKLKCAKHPRYAGKESPRCACKPCQFIYNMRQYAYANHVTVVEAAPPKQRNNEPEVLR